MGDERGNLVPPSKRQKLGLSASEQESRDALRKTCLGMVRHWYELMEATHEVPEKDLYCQEQIVSAMNNSFKLWRQSVNGTGNVSIRAQYLANKVNVNGKEVALSIYEHWLKKLLTTYDLPTTKGSEWIGIVTPCLTLFSLHKYRMEELRMGHNRIPENKDVAYDISRYGLTSAHGVLLEGIRWPPAVRSSCAGSVGPLTQMLCLRKSRQGQGVGIDFTRKWRSALMDSIAHIPHYEEIISQAVKCSDAEFNQLIRALGDVLLFTGGRQQQKVALPIEAILTRSKERKQLIMKTIATPDADVAAVELPELGISGKRATVAYNKLVGIQYPKIKDEQTTKQVFFHAVFGTYKDNLELLKWMTQTDFSWTTRAEIGKHFSQGERGQRITFNPIMISYYSKVSSANQSQFFRNTSQQFCSLPTFSGKYETEASCLIKYIEDTSDAGSFGAVGINTLVQTLKLHFNSMHKRIKEIKIQSWGNTEWENIIDQMTTINPKGTFKERFFFGTNTGSDV